MKVLRILLYILLLLILIIFVAMLSLVLFMDPNRLKPALIAEVKHKTGYHLTINGNLAWRFYPFLAIKARQIALSSNQNMPPFVEMRNASIAVPITDVLKKNTPLKGKIYVEHLVFNKVQADKVSIHLAWRNKILNLQPITANLYNGSFQGVAHGNFVNQPSWDWNVQFNNVNLQPLLNDLSSGQAKLKISGLANATLKASTLGVNRAQLIGNLQGSSELNIKNGMLSGIDLNYLLITADALINKSTPNAPAENIRQTTFDELSGSAIIRQGVVNTNNLYLVAKAFTAKATGEIKLLPETIDLDIRVQSQQILKTQWEIPVRILGPLTHPDVMLNMSELQKQILNREIDKAKTKIEEKINEKAQDFIGKFLDR